MTKRQRRAKRRRAMTGAGVGIGAALAFSPAAQADVETFTVDSTADPGDANCATNGCTLREALGLANDSDPPGDVDTVVFQSGVTGSVTLGGTVLGIYDSLVIEGPGAGTLAIDGADASRILNIGVAAPEAVDISGLTITNANGPPLTSGGAIFNDSDLTVRSSVLTGNSGDSGGAIYSGSGSSVTVLGSTVSDNSADYPTGGTGAAIAIGLGTGLTIAGSTISGNMATGTAGYGVIRANQTPLTILSSTISGNSSTGNDAGVRIEQAMDDPAVIENSTIADNHAAGNGGGLSRIGIAGTPAGTTLSNTLIADNTAATGPDVFGAVTAGFSLIENTSGATITESPAGSNVTGLDPELGPLADNGGRTMTHGFLFGTSPALDAGQVAGITDTDQRGPGFPRPFDLPDIANASGGDGSDIGAFESQVLPPIPAPPPPITPITPISPGTTPAPPAAPQGKKKCKKKRGRVATAAKKCVKKR